MKNTTLRTWQQGDMLISVAVFLFLLVYTYGLLFLVPYSGFYFNPTDGMVTIIYEDRTPAAETHLQVGDILKQVGTITFEEYSNSLRVNFFEGQEPGDVIEIKVERNGAPMTVPWVYTGFTSAQFSAHFFNIWWLAYIFLFIGTATQIFMRPKDQRWALFVAANYLTGMFIMVGSLSSFGFLGSPALLRVVAWLMLPVYLHFHWIFPHSLRPVPRWVKFAFYLICGAFAVWQFFLIKPSPLYFLALILAFGGSILLLLIHYVVQREYRRELRILAVAAVLSLGFMIVASIVASSGPIPRGAILSLLALPVLPGAYFYILYGRSLGGLELRANRLISIYLFTVLLGGFLLIVFSLINISRETTIFMAVMASLVSGLASLVIFPGFQAVVERRFLGIKLPSQSMSENYSARITTSTSLHGLLKLLGEEVFPSLLIRQYAFVRIENSTTQILISRDVDLESIRKAAMPDVLTMDSVKTLTKMLPAGFEWVRLALPLKVGSDLLGVWLLGRRDPDDHYPQAELPILNSLANQTAVALSNIIQTERLKVVYEANIHRYEQERLRLGHELHDSLLNEMAAMLMKYDPDVLPREFQDSFDGLIVRLREIVTDLRPPMLVYGLKYALDGLADNLSQRNNDVVQVVSEIQQEEDCRYPEIVEHNIYRVVQEACENALKYARAKAIRIVGKLSSGRISIQVVDDGIGFKNDVSLLLDEMVVNKHYGLAGMHERAELIGAVIRIESRPNQGAQVQVSWEAKETM